METMDTRATVRNSFNAIRVDEQWGEPCEVLCDPAGAPQELVLRGRIHRVMAPPQRWYQRRPWWELDQRIPRETDRCAVERQHWRVQAAQCGAVEPCTVELVRHEVTGQWWVVADQGV